MLIFKKFSRLAFSTNKQVCFLKPTQGLENCVHKQISVRSEEGMEKKKKTIIFISQYTQVENVY